MTKEAGRKPILEIDGARFDDRTSHRRFATPYVGFYVT
jgi:hypothetical protein